MRLLSQVLPMLAGAAFALAVGSHSVASGQEEHDAVRSLLESYQLSVESVTKEGNVTVEEKAAWREEWLTRFVHAEQSNPDSSLRRQVLIKALGLSNSLGKYELSAEIVGKLLAIETSPELKARWTTELGEVKRLRYFQTHDSNDREAAAVAFGQAAEQLQGDSGEQAALEQQILNLVWAAELIDNSEGGQSPAESAAKNFFRARELLRLLPNEPQGRLLQAGYTSERLAVKQLIAAGREQDDKLADDALASLRQAASLDRPLSYYYVEFVLERYNSDDEISNALEEWLRHNKDPWSPIVRYRLAKSLHSSGKVDAALVQLEHLVDHDMSRLLEVDSQAIQLRRGGHLVDVLYLLGRIRIDRRNYRSAIQPLQMLVELFPNDSRASYARSMLKYVDDVRRSPTLLRRIDVNTLGASLSGWKGVLIILNAVFVGILISGCLIRKLLRRGTD